MTNALQIALVPERLDTAVPEERACFGRFTIQTAAGFLTAGIDHYIEGYRAGPLVSGYHAAEWFAWNWWRLRYEPRSRAPDWWRAHTMTAIGEGYSWPNITAYSDGVRTTLLCDPSQRPDTKPFRYLGASATVLPSAEFEVAVDEFIGLMEGKLIEAGITDTNLSRIWAELLAERANPVEAERRRLEALMAREPDDGDDDIIKALMAETNRFGAEEIGELAAQQGDGGEKLTGTDLERMAIRRGSQGRVSDAAALPPETKLPAWGEVPAWRIAAAAAEVLRIQAGLSDRPVSDETLTALAGVERRTLVSSSAAPLAFVIDHENGSSATMLRSRNKEGRRFELARLIGDRLVRQTGAPLYPATRAYTYRQKIQRSFAAELLCPFTALEDFLKGDVSPEKREDAADHFRVSERTIRTLLVNHDKLEREELDFAA